MAQGGYLDQQSFPQFPRYTCTHGGPGFQSGWYPDGTGSPTPKVFCHGCNLTPAVVSIDFPGNGEFTFPYRQVEPIQFLTAFINSFSLPPLLFFYLVDSIVHFVEHRVRDLIGFPLFRFESEESVTSCAD
jgi:hypothetical protein